jgi:hypothetical protein
VGFKLLSLLGGTLKDLFKEDPLLLVSIILALFVLVWMFKEIQSYTKNRADRDITQLEKKLVAYGQLRTYVTLFIESRKQEDKVQLLNHIGENTPFMSYPLFQRSYLLLEKTDTINEFNDYLKEIDDEIKAIKFRYRAVSPDEDGTQLFGSINRYIQLIEYIGKPFCLTALTIGIIIIAILTSSLAGKGNYVGFLNVLSAVLLFGVTFVNLSLILDHKFNHSKKNWTIFLGLIFSSIVLMYLHHWFLSIFNIAIIFIYLLLFAPVLKRE